MSEKDEYNFGAFAKEVRRDISAYVDARIEYMRLTAYEKVAQVAGESAVMVLLLIFSFFAAFFLSLAAAILLGSWLKSMAAGYSIIALLDLIAILFVLLKKEPLKEKISGKVIDRLLTAHQNDRKENEAAG